MSDKVRDYYNINAQKENERLNSAHSRIEFLSTMRLIDKYFPAAGKVCDIGGGTGKYTVELFKKGYDVTLVDISEREIEKARSNLNEFSFSTEKTYTADASNLNFIENKTFDCGLLLGPMYHTTDSKKRNRILKEFNRILKPDAIGIIAYINSWGLLKTGLNDFPRFYRDPEFGPSLLKSKNFSSQDLPGFTESNWSTPPEATVELTSHGFEVISYAGVEGFTGSMHRQLAEIRETDMIAYNNIADFAVNTAELSPFRDITDHMHFVVRKKK